MLKRIFQQASRVAITLIVTGAAIILGRQFWQSYVESPWTRDGRVRAGIVTIAPDVSGSVVSLRIRDNQPVHKGDLLFVIDPARFQLALDQAEAVVQSRKNVWDQRRRELERRNDLAATTAIPREELEQAQSAVMVAEASYNESVVARDIARLNLARTEVRSPVNGYVTNLLLDEGDYATTGKASVAIVDSDSFYVAGYFEETKIGHIRVGAPVSIRLMGFPAELRGHVGSIASAISDRENLAGSDLVADVNPTFSWVRLAQRIPVYIVLDRVPETVRISAGMTATVVVEEGAPAGPGVAGAL